MKIHVNVCKPPNKFVKMITADLGVTEITKGFGGS